LGSASSPVIGRLCAFPVLAPNHRCGGGAERPRDHRAAELKEGAAALPGPDRRGTGAMGGIVPHHWYQWEE
ncbi:unnamed protein product, partial [Staurois parvus]